MAARLGYVLNWIAMIIALGFVILGVALLMTPKLHHGNEAAVVFAMCFGAALAVVLLGRAIRYILAGQ